MPTTVETPRPERLGEATLHPLPWLQDLKFHTKDHQMVFVDHLTHGVASPHTLQPNHDYDIFLVIENTGSEEYLNVQVAITHSPFGIGMPAGTAGLIQPAPVDVPPQSYGMAGQATVEFHFRTPPGGHGCLVAKIQQNGRTLQQNTDVIGSPIGAVGNLSFLVFGGAAQETMTLTMTEAPTGWFKGWVAPPSANPISAGNKLTLTLAAHTLYSIGLQVKIPDTATGTHVFTVEGKVGTHIEGSVQIIVPAQPKGTLAPDPYMLFGAGCQSPDILLFDPNGHPVPLGGLPYQGNTLLIPNTDYELRAVVHNASATAAPNTVVEFWQFSGSAGTRLGVETCTIPGNHNVEVTCTAAPFHSPAGGHACAVVTVSNSQATDPLFQTPPTSWPAVLNMSGPALAHPYHSPVAWRNTNSMYVFKGRPWEFILAAHHLGPDPVEVGIHIETLHVPRAWETSPRVAEIAQIVQESIGSLNQPLFLRRDLQQTLPKANMQIKITSRDEQVRISGRPNGAQQIANVRPGAPADVVIAGTVPPDAQPGDRYLVHVTTHYPQMGETRPFTTEFVEVLYVKE